LENIKGYCCIASLKVQLVSASYIQIPCFVDERLLLVDKRLKITNTPSEDEGVVLLKREN
jgi:hypothetical protein